MMRNRKKFEIHGELNFLVFLMRPFFDVARQSQSLAQAGTWQWQ